MSNEVEIVVSDKYISRGGFTAAKKEMKDLSADAKKAGDDAGKQFSNGLEDNVNKGMKGLGSNVKTAGNTAGKQFSSGMGDSVSAGKDGITGKITGMLSGLAGGGLLLGAGAAIGSALMDGISTKLEKGALQGQMKAQYGLTTKDAADAGKTAGELYTNGFGDSIAETSAVIGNVRSSFKGLAADGVNSLTSISKGALTVAKVFGVDVNDVIKVTSQLLKTGLAKDATEALDIVAKGFQNGMNVGGDFLDTINEYSPYFKQLGLDAKDGLGLVNQMLQAGARDADYAADAIKEFGIRAIDGSKGTVNAFHDIGLNAEEMAAKIAAGGPAAKEAFGQVISALQAMKDPVAQNSAGVGLFGTQWEDTVRAILPNIDLTKSGFEGVKGTVDGMNKSISETDTAKVEGLGRSLEKAKENMADFFTQNNSKTYEINFDANTGMAEEQYNGFIDKVNNASGTVNINGNDNNAVNALVEIQHAIDSGQGTVLINGNPMPAQEAKKMVEDQINQAAGTVTINGNTQPAASAVNNLVGNTNNQQAAISVQAYTAQANSDIEWAARNRSTTIFINTVGTVNGASVAHSYAHGGIVSQAATGGVRAVTTMNEQGPEAVKLPDGSTVMPAGATRALENRWAEGGGGGETTLIVEARSDAASQFLAEMIRKFVKVKGGNVQNVLGARG